MKTTFLCILLLLLMLTIGCGDRDAIKGLDVSGSVFEYGTLNPIEGARVYLVGASSSGVSGPNWNLVDTFITGPDGRYAFRRSEEPVTVALYVYADQYYDILEKAVKFPEKKQEIDIVMDPYAWIKLHIKNTSPYDMYDLLSFSGEWGGGGLPDYYGMNVDLYYLQKVYGNRFIDVYWGVTKSNNFNFSQDSIFTIAHDTVIFEIFY